MGAVASEPSPQFNSEKIREQSTSGRACLATNLELTQICRTLIPNGSAADQGKTGEIATGKPSS
jgi:hypothetical protein